MTDPIEEVIRHRVQRADEVRGDNDGRVTLAELKRWLDKRVPVEARKMGGNQTPTTSLVDAWGEVYLTR